MPLQSENAKLKMPKAVWLKVQINLIPDGFRPHLLDFD
jgi:hypothetical protein